MALVLKHATLQQLGQAFRERYKNAKGIEVAKLARFMEGLILDGTVTQTQVRNFFGLDQTQWNTLKAKWDNYKTKLEELEVAEGE